MKREDVNKKLPIPKEKKKGSQKFPGYPGYPPSEDIFNQFIEEGDIDPEDITKKKSPIEKVGSPNEKDFTETLTGNDLDIPGAGLDDAMENIGSEDEENNYYSLGGGDHDDLDERTGVEPLAK
jgi:hypothetical protein